MNTCTVLFPMAGNGMRFGGTFKPFLNATEKTFIELAKEPFSVYEDVFSMKYIFIFRKDQEIEFNVSNRLRTMFPNDSINFFILDKETSGPLNTVHKAISSMNLKGQIFICDCDHIIPQDEIKIALLKESPDVLIPTYEFKNNESSSWSKVVLNHLRIPLFFKEKEFVDPSYDYIIEGMIGCHYIKDCTRLLPFDSLANFSDIFSKLLNCSILCVPIHKAEFFGTPEQLKKFRSDRAQYQTFFIDIDGTLLYLSNYVSYDSDPSLLLPDTISTLTKWKKNGHTIVLTTGRGTDRRKLLENQLKELEIPYDQLITGLPSGPRVIINDKKPYCIFHPMAQSVQLRRNEGISRVQIESTPTIIKTLHGGSSANIFLIKRQSGEYRIRKYIEKRPDTKPHVDVLRRQYEDMKRISSYSPSLLPNIYLMQENNDEYYFDMEYLEGYVELVSCSDDVIKHVITRLYQVLSQQVYVYKKEINGKEWMDQYINEKIKAKYSAMESFGFLFSKVIHDTFVTINGVSYKGLGHYFSTEDLSPYYPSHITTIHGDLTLENILYHPETDSFKIIDVTNTRYADPVELDMGKLLQDLVALVSKWDTMGTLVEYRNDEFIIPSVLFQEQSKYDYIPKLYNTSTKVAMFYLCTHMIRLIPYAHVTSPDKALCALLYAVSHL